GRLGEVTQRDDKKINFDGYHPFSAIPGTVTQEIGGSSPPVVQTRSFDARGRFLTSTATGAAVDEFKYDCLDRLYHHRTTVPPALPASARSSTTGAASRRATSTTSSATSPPRAAPGRRTRRATSSCATRTTRAGTSPR